MLETSKDVLYLVIAFCVLWVTVFLCWMFYYAMRVLRSTNQIVEEFRMKLQMLAEAINYIRGKVETIHSILDVATQGVGGAIKSYVSRKAKEYVSKGANRADSAAKDAVDRAVEATAEKMRKAAKKIKK